MLISLASLRDTRDQCIEAFISTGLKLSCDARVSRRRLISRRVLGRACNASLSSWVFFLSRCEDTAVGTGSLLHPGVEALIPIIDICEKSQNSEQTSKTSHMEVCLTVHVAGAGSSEWKLITHRNVRSLGRM